MFVSLEFYISCLQASINAESYKQINDVTQWFSNLYAGEHSFVCGSTKDRLLKLSITLSTNNSQTNSKAAHCLQNTAQGCGGKFTIRSPLQVITTLQTIYLQTKVF
jgi:predicted transport protein